MIRLPFLSGRARVVLVGAAVAVVTLLVAGWALMAYDTQNYRAQKLNETTVQARILGASVTAALIFDDAKTVSEYIDAVRANSEIDAAAVYDATGKVVAQTAREGAAPVPERSGEGRFEADGDFIVVVQPIVQSGERVGAVYLRTATEPAVRRISRYAALILLLAMGSLVLGILVVAQAILRKANEELSDTNAQLRTQIVERERAEEALRQAQKMEAIGQLTGGIAHDFNNMLAIIIGSLSLLKRRVARGERDLDRYADAALEGANRAATLTQRLLAFARRQPLNPQPVDLNRLVAGLSEMLRRTLGETIQIETVLAGGAWRTKADAHQLENAILNLGVNSRDAMPNGGRLTIETANVDLDDRYAAAHTDVRPGQYAMIAVSDTGAGMKPETVERAFEPFFTTKTVGKGTGLGLSQVYGFVRQSGGHVKIYSEVGQGTSIKIYLPRLIGEHEAEAVVPTMGPPSSGEGVTILVVEDEAGVRKLAIDALTELGYRPLEADGAAAALRLIPRHPEIRLMFTDIVMPEVDGRRLADQALKLRPKLKVLFTTGYTRNAVVHHGVVDPGVHLLGKPYSLDQLAAKIRAVLDEPD